VSALTTDDRPVAPLAYGMGDAADLIGVSRQHLYNLVHAGKVASVNVGRRRLVRMTEIDRILNEGVR
jgi:excisionase family DNA binding protein